MDINNNSNTLPLNNNTAFWAIFITFILLVIVVAVVTTVVNFYVIRRRFPPISPWIQAVQFNQGFTSYPKYRNYGTVEIPASNYRDRRTTQSYSEAETNVRPPRRAFSMPIDSNGDNVLKVSEVRDGNISAAEPLLPPFWPQVQSPFRSRARPRARVWDSRIDKC